MKKLGEMMRGRGPTDDEVEVMERVVRLSLSWQMGDITLDEVRAASTGFERFTAVRFAELGSQNKREIMSLLDGLVEDDDTRRRNDRESPNQHRPR
jgi:hypothetical protein